MGRAPCCDKTKVKRGPWSPEEDVLLKNYITKNGTGGNWISLPQRAGLNRCGKSCRLRWLNYLRPDIKHGGFTEQEDCVICTLYIAIGSRWSVIASKLPGRTDNDVKNYWNTKLRKKILAGQVAGFTTHQPPMIYNHMMTTNYHYPNGSSDPPPLQDELEASFSAHNVGLTTPSMQVQVQVQVQQPSLNYNYNSCWVQEEDKKVGIAEENWVPPQVTEINNMNWVSPSPYYHDIPSGSSGQLSASLSSSGATTRASSSSSSSAALSEETNSFGGCSSSSWAPMGSLMMNCKLEENINNVVEGGECFWTRLLETNYHHHHHHMIVEGSQQLEQKIHEFASVLDDY